MYNSVIIPTYKKETRLLLALQSFLVQDYPPEKYEIIIVAKEPSETIRKAIVSARRKLDIKLIIQKGTGRANARNEGIRRASGEVIVFTDDDLLLSSNFISQHVDSHQDKNVVSLGKVFQVYLSCLDKVELKEIFKRLPSIAREDIYFKTVRKAFSFENNSIPWIGFGTNNVSLRKDALIKIGLFDEDFIGWGQDNIELGYRLYKRGYRFTYNPLACNYHLAHPRNKENLLKDITRNLEIFYKKQPETPVKLYRDFIFGKISLEYFNNSIAKGADSDLDRGKIFYREYIKLLQWVSSNEIVA